MYCRVHDTEKAEVFGLFIGPQRHDHGWGSVSGGAGAKPYESLSKGNNSMATTSSKAVLITGANVGLGKEVARQLALTGDFDRIYLACRNADSGQSAAADLERITGRSIFTVIRMDLTDLDSVRSALSTLDRELHSVVMNAGGTGGPTPLALTADRRHTCLRFQRTGPRRPARESPRPPGH